MEREGGGEKRRRGEERPARERGIERQTRTVRLESEVISRKVLS